MEKQIWILNPDYSFKNDGDRICMYTKKERKYDSSADWIGYIHPTQAMILGVFTSGRSLIELCQELSRHLTIDVNVLQNLIEKYIENDTPVYTKWGNTSILFPKNVLICADKINIEQIHYDFSFDELQCNKVDITPDRSHLAPHSILWMMTTACATNCKYCYADRKTIHNPLSTARILELIDEFHSLKMGYIDLIGGEFFLRKDWDIILKKLVDYGMSPTYLSTKLPITESIGDKLLATNYHNVIQISLDSMSDDVLHKTIGTPSGYVEKIKDGIAILEKHGYHIQIDTILTSENSNCEDINNLYDYIKTIKNLTIWEIRVPELSLYTPHTFSEIKASKFVLRNIRNYVNSHLIPNAPIKIVFSSEALDEKFRQDGPTKECFQGGTCGILQNRAFVLPDGKVSICEQMYWHKDFIIGDLSCQSIIDIWNSPKAHTLFKMSKALFRKESACYHCNHFSKCNQSKRRCVVKVVKAYGLDNWDYPDPRCKFAPDLKTDLKY
ncbi:MAG: radical SAM protein [Muribaculum sp.]|nr:radical SAM protein [Muribaculum sp.]